MIRYTEFLLLLRGKNLRIKDIIYGLIGRVWVGFGPKIYGIFGFGLFRVWVEKIVFRIQNFGMGSDRVNF